MFHIDVQGQLVRSRGVGDLLSKGSMVRLRVPNKLFIYVFFLFWGGRVFFFYIYICFSFAQDFVFLGKIFSRLLFVER